MRILARLLRRRYHRLCRSLSSSSPSPTPIRAASRDLRRATKALYDEPDLDKLVTDFKSLSADPRFRTNRPIYEIIVRRLASANRFASIEDLLESQKLHSRDITREGFAVRLISLYASAGMLSHAAATFDQLPSLGCRRTVSSFNALLTACAQAGDAARLAVVFRDVPRSDPSIVPDCISYNILVLALCEKGDIDAALDALRLMEEDKVEPNLVTFNTLLKGFYTNGRFLDGEKVWEKMKEKNIKPDIRSYNAKLRGLVCEGKTMEAVELVSKLESLGLEPDTFSFNAVIKGFIQDENLEEARRVYLDLANNGCAPNRWTFEMLIPKFCEADELDVALKICYDSISRRCFVDVGVVQQVVDELARKSRVKDAKTLVERGRLKSFARRNLKLPLPSLE